MADIEERVARIERDYAGLDQRALAMTQQLTTLAGFPLQIVRLESSLQSLREAMADMRRELADSKAGAEKHALQQSEERRALKLALIGLTGVILAALIGAVAVIVAHL